MLRKCYIADDLHNDLIELYNFLDDNEQEITSDNLDIFKAYCENIKTLYKFYYENKSESRNENIEMLNAYTQLMNIANLPEDSNRNIKMLAQITIDAILDIRYIPHDDTVPTQLKIHKSGFTYKNREYTVWYDFEKDTPEMLWERLSKSSY